MFPSGSEFTLVSGLARGLRIAAWLHELHGADVVPYSMARSRRACKLERKCPWHVGEIVCKRFRYNILNISNKRVGGGVEFVGPRASRWQRVRDGKA